MLELRVTPAEGGPFQHQVSGETLVIGRSSKCDLPIADRSLSRRHARLYLSDGTWMVEDLGSRNGTRVNGSIIGGAVPVQPGDVISVSASMISIGGARQARAASRRSTAETEGTILRPASDIIAESEAEFALSPGTADPELRRSADQLRVLYDVHHALDASTSAEELLDNVLERVFKHMQPDHGAVFLEDGDALLRAASRSRWGGADEFPESQHLAREVIDKGLVAVVQDTSTDRRFANAASLLDAGVRTLVAAPLLTPHGAMGMIVLSSTRAGRRFAESDMEMLAIVASATGLRLRNFALAEEAAERRRFEQEVALARRIQVALLPAEMPHIPGIEIHGGNIPSRGVSGDYYQVVARGDHEVAVVVADVSGKGIAASLLTGYVDALVNAFLGEGMEPAPIFDRVSPQMNAKTPAESFATAFLGILSVADGSMRYASAGHDPAILVRSSGDVELLMPTGMPLGLMPTATYTSSQATLGAGDILVLYTDGITEARNAADQMFERERLIEACRRHRARSAAEIAASIHAEVESFVAGRPYHDDRTLVIVRRLAV